MKKFIFVIFCLFVALFVGFCSLSFSVSTIPKYEHAESDEYFRTSVMDPADYNGPSGSDIFSTVSVGNLSEGYRVWVNFSSKTSGQEVILKRVTLKSEALNLSRKYDERLRLETLDKGFYEAYKIVFDGLDEAEFEASVKDFDIVVDYEFNGQSHNVVFNVVRREMGVPIH